MEFPRTWTAEEAAATVSTEWGPMSPPAGCERGRAWMAWRDGLQAAVRAGLVECRGFQTGDRYNGQAWSEWRRVS